MKTKTFRVGMQMRDYALYGIPYLLSTEQRAILDNWLKEKRILSVLSASSPYMAHYGEHVVDLKCKLSHPLKEYIIDAFQANLSRGAAPEVFAWLSRKGLVDEDDYVTLYDGSISLADDAFYCENRSDYYPDSEDSVQVKTSIRRGADSETWCREAAESDAFECQHSGHWFCNENFTCVGVEGDSVCLEYNEGEIHYWESDGEYHWDYEPEEEDDDDDDGVSDYHGSPKPWRNASYKGLVFGCELELYATADRVDVGQIANDCGLFAERDGSLDGEHGIEVIGSPMSLAETQDKDGPWLKFLAAVQGKAKGWNAGTGYGLHVSVNRDGMSHYLTGKLLVFIHGNQSLCEGIAGRSANQWQKYVCKNVKDGKATSGEKYEALAIRSRSRLECRIFRSTLKPEGFLRGVEFVAASVEFCRDASAIALTESAFLEWLKLPENCGAYPNLCLHLGIKKPRQ
jgi:hypothetical protein